MQIYHNHSLFNDLKHSACKGLSKIPDQVLKNLINHKNLGLHTKMLSDEYTAY